MRFTHYTIRDIKALDGVPAASPEWDVVAKRDDGTCYYSGESFPSFETANRFVTRCIVEPMQPEYWEANYLDAMHVNRIPHDSWIMVPRMDIERPNPPVSNYDDEAEPSGERAGRLAYIAAQRPSVVMEHHEPKLTMEAMRLSVYHSDTEIKVRDDDFTGDNVITLWKIRGVPKTFYPTKIAAEVAARAHFPHDNPTVRYSRITFIEVDYDFNFGEAE